jgi:hypothetical protein
MPTHGGGYAFVEDGLVDQMLFNQSYVAGQAEASDISIDVAVIRRRSPVAGWRRRGHHLPRRGRQFEHVAEAAQ